MPRSNPDFHQKSFRIKHDDDDDKFLSRLLSKETTSKSNSSFRVYYGEISSAVPFMWETRPGTPKHTAFSDNINCKIPPLTPPPSYYTNNIYNLSHSSSSKKQYYYCYYRSKLQLLQTLLRRMNSKKASLASSPKYSSSSPSLSNSHLSWPSSSSRNSSFCDPISMMSAPNDHGHVIRDINRRRRRRFSSWGSSSFDHSCSEMDINAHRDEKAKDIYSTGEMAHQAGASSVLILKKALLSILGRGSA